MKRITVLKQLWEKTTIQKLKNTILNPKILIKNKLNINLNFLEKELGLA